MAFTNHIRNGYVDEVLEFSFIKGYRVVLFKCIWYDTDRKRKHVKFEPHFISVDTTKQAYKEDPFVLANQATQVFYIDDPINASGWKIIERSTHRHLWDIPDNEDAEDVFEHVETSSQTTPLVAADCEYFGFLQEDGEEEIVQVVDDESKMWILLMMMNVVTLGGNKRVRKEPLPKPVEGSGIEEDPKLSTLRRRKRAVTSVDKTAIPF
ncbi:hypothetical protein LXL04_034180 [Taraxacum kok-saghyz]